MNGKQMLVASIMAMVLAQASGDSLVLNPVNDLQGSLSQNTITLTWTDRSTGEDRYELQVLRKYKGYSQVEATIPVPADSVKYQFGPVSPHRDYIFRIRPANNLTSTAFSNTITIKVR